MDGRAHLVEKPLIDAFGRAITYLRLSVTDRCDLRCAYCMSEDAVFEPRAALLSLEELYEVVRAFVARGVRRVRLTGGEPLGRRNVLRLIERIGALKSDGALDEVTLTTNGTRLAEFAPALHAAGVRRINLSLDTLDRERFAAITRRDSLPRVQAGIDAALAAGLHVKINTVALANSNLDDIPTLVAWAHERGMDITLIEVMPMGEVAEDRIDQYAPLSEVQRSLSERWRLKLSGHRTGGPARYFDVEETGGRIGFITPLTGNFCDGCNRVRVNCTGQLYMCLGQEAKVDLRAALREGGAAALDRALDEAMARKPQGHDFSIEARGAPPASPRFMSATGG